MRTLLLVFCLIVAGCQSNPVNNDAQPNWWLSPPQDNEQWLYGLGEGYSLEAANQQALANLAGKLRTNISTTLSRRTQETNYAADDLIDRQVSSKIAEIPLSNYETFKTKTLNNTTITIVRVNKQSLANDWLRQHKAISEEIKNASSSISSNRFKWWIETKSLMKEAIEADHLAEFYTALSGEEIKSTLTKELANILQNKKPSAFIKGKDNAINREIRSQLISEGIQVNKCNKCDLTLSYKMTYSSEVLFGENISKLSFSSFIINDGDVVTSNLWQFKASSVQDSKASRKATAYMALQKIKKEGLWKTFGMEAN